MDCNETDPGYKPPVGLFVRDPSDSGVPAIEGPCAALAIPPKRWVEDRDSNVVYILAGCGTGV